MWYTVYKEKSIMKNDNVKKEYIAPEIIVTIVENDIITFSEDTISWEGPIVGA